MITKRPELGVWLECSTSRQRRVMHDAVNKERAAAGLGPVFIAAVERVETMAEGHSDYSSKFALYCAELALGVRDIKS